MTIESARREFAKFALGLLFRRTELPVGIEQLRYEAERANVAEDVEYVLNRDLTASVFMGSLHEDILRQWFHDHVFAQQEVF